VPSAFTIVGPTFSNSIGKALPAIPGLSTLVYFGTGGDAIETNRNPGGPALSVLSGTPVHSANYVSLGGQAGMTRFDSIDTHNLRTAGMLSSGWTWCAVARASGAGNAHVVMDYLTIAPTQSMAINIQTNSKINFYSNGVRATITTTVPTTSWHFVALTYTGGAAGTGTVYSFTQDITTGAPATPWTAASIGSGNYSPRFGGISTDTASWNNSVDVAFGLVASGVLSVPTMATIAASVRLSLARRGITI